MEAKELPVGVKIEQLEAGAQALVQAYASGLKEAFKRARQSHPAYKKRNEAELRAAVLSLDEARLVIAREYGFDDWPSLRSHLEALAMKDSAVSRFEAAADAIVSGDLETLGALLQAHPDLVRQRSTRLHQATLLHYTSANGVEDFRQKTPPNIVRVAERLFEAGADVDATARTYGGGQTETTLNLLVSSQPPYDAGQQVPLLNLLLDRGAAINGLENDGSPLITALAFGYTEAAHALAQRGARIDTVAVAAGVGREDLVRSFMADGGQLKAGVPLIRVSWLRLPAEPKANLELAAAWASLHGHAGITALLARHDVDANARDQWGGLRH